MSYINDALRKVQKEKESRYAAYGNIVSAPGKKSEPAKTWLSIMGISIVFFVAAGIIVLLYWPEDLLYRPKVKKIPAVAPLRTSDVQSVVPAAPLMVSNAQNAASAAPQVVKETIADNKIESGLKTETASAEIKARPEIADSKMLYAQAVKKHTKGKLEEAKILYRKVVKIDRYNMQAYNNLGVIYMSEKNYKRAIMRFKDAIKIKHDYSDAHYNLACVYAKRNNTGRSLLYLKNAVAFNPEVIKWAKDDGDLQALADLPEFKKLLERP